MKNTQSLNTDLIKSLPKFWTGLTGFLLILMALSAGIAYGYSFSSLYDSSNSSQTLSHLLEDPSKLTMGLAFWALILILDLLVSFGLYKLLQSTLKSIAYGVMGSRIVYSGFLAFAIGKMLNLWVQLNSHSTDVNADFVQSSFADFNQFWSLGLIVFGVHLLLLAYGFQKTSVVPKMLSYLIGFAGFSYMLVHGLGQFGEQGLSLRYTLEPILALPMALAELLLAIWLIYIGLNQKFRA